MPNPESMTTNLGQIMESAKLSFRRINVTALSPTPTFNARHKPHYQMRKQSVGKKKKKIQRWHNALGRLSLQSSFTDGTGGRKSETCFHFISRVLPRFIWQRGFKCIGLMTMSRQFLNRRLEERDLKKKKNGIKEDVTTCALAHCVQMFKWISKWFSK